MSCSSDDQYQSLVIKDLTQSFKSFFANGQLIDGCIQCQDQELLPYPQNPIQKLYVRKCYKEVFDLIMGAIGRGMESFAISGTSGVGKSCFFIYILYRLVKDFSKKSLPLKPNRILLQTHSSFICFDLKTQVVTTNSHWNAEKWVREKDTFYIIDATCQPLCSSCMTLFLSSSQMDYYKRFVVQKMANQWYFPTWTLNELTLCGEYCYPKLKPNIIKGRYDIYGGVARTIFCTLTLDADTKVITNALSDMDAVKSVHNIGIPTRIRSSMHDILHMVVSNDGQYHFLYIDIASKYVGEQLWIQYHDIIMYNLNEMFLSSPTEISRHLFEIYGHRIFSSGGTSLDCKCLEDGTVTKLTLKTLERITFDHDSILTSKDLIGYYEPTDKENFPTVDSLCSLGLFRFSVSHHDPIRGIRILTKLCELYKEPKLYFVVPPHLFSGFKKQNLTVKNGTRDVKGISKLKQYVIELPVI